MYDFMGLLGTPHYKVTLYYVAPLYLSLPRLPRNREAGKTLSQYLEHCSVVGWKQHAGLVDGGWH